MTAMITALYASLCAIIIVALGIKTISLRLKTQTGLGDGDNDNLRRAMRVHGNATEYIPIALILMYLAELGGTAAMWLHGAGVLLIVSRCAHAWGLGRSSGSSVGRTAGTMGTFTVILCLAIVNLFTFLQ